VVVMQGRDTICVVREAVAAAGEGMCRHEVIRNRGEEESIRHDVGHVLCTEVRDAPFPL
jgi:hypothetical protein